MAVSPDTAQQIITGIRVLLRRVDDIALPDTDILEVLNDLCKQYVQEESLATRDRRTEVAPVTITEGATNDDADFTCELEGIADFEPLKLEYAPLNTPDGILPWREITIVPFAAWATHFNGGYRAAAFYGSSSLATPCKVKLTFLDSQVELLRFRLSYRLPLLTIVQQGDRPPIPSAHLPMLKREAAILCAPLVQDDSASWKTFKAENIDGVNSGYMLKLAELKANWKAYLETSVEPQIQPIKRSDRANLSNRLPVRPFVPPQS